MTTSGDLPSQQHKSVLDNSLVAAAYARWAPVYDLTFTLVMRAGRKAAAAAIGRPGGHILDVGVGIGLQGGESAMSLGYQRAISDRATVTLGGAFSSDDASVGVGAGFGW